MPGLVAFAVLRHHEWLSEATIGATLPQPTAETFAWAEIAASGGDIADHERIVAAFIAFFADEAPTLARLGLVT